MKDCINDVATEIFLFAYKSYGVLDNQNISKQNIFQIKDMIDNTLWA